jgi:hypothetical protein
MPRTHIIDVLMTNLFVLANSSFSMLCMLLFDIKVTIAGFPQDERIEAVIITSIVFVTSKIWQIVWDKYQVSARIKSFKNPILRHGRNKLKQ